jgi:hypothetical protein
MKARLFSIIIALAHTLNASAQDSSPDRNDRHPQKGVDLIKEAYEELTAVKDDTGGHRLKAIRYLERFAKKMELTSQKD